MSGVIIFIFTPLIRLQKQINVPRSINIFVYLKTQNTNRIFFSIKMLPVPFWSHLHFHEIVALPSLVARQKRENFAFV